jgi:hypothetical protein
MEFLEIFSRKQLNLGILGILFKETKKYWNSTNSSHETKGILEFLEFYSREKRKVGFS